MKPKYSINKNFFYAIDGAKVLVKETSFKIELVCFILGSIILFFLTYPLWAKVFMFASMLIPLIAEAFNTAIEKSIDLISPEYSLLAKHAKDLSAFAVLLTVFIPIFVWIGFIMYFTEKI